MEQEAVKFLLRRGKPTRIEKLASQLGVDLETLRDVHEPWLERSGLVERTKDGRVANEKAMEVYGALAGAEARRRHDRTGAFRAARGSDAEPEVWSVGNRGAACQSGPRGPDPGPFRPGVAIGEAERREPSLLRRQ